MGTERVRPLIQKLGKGGQASEVLPARAKDSCGLGVSDRAASFVSIGF